MPCLQLPLVSSNQMPAFNATHTQMNERTHVLEKIKYITNIGISMHLLTGLTEDQTLSYSVNGANEVIEFQTH